MDTPLVTIGIPYYKSESYILQTLESVKNQSYKHIELILVNDCSPDNCQLVVDEWLKCNEKRFVAIKHIINPENRGVAYSSKILQKAARGVYFSKLDADDIILPAKIAEQVKFLEANEETALVYSNTLLIDAKGNLLEKDYFTRQKFSTVVQNVGPSGEVFHELLLEDFIPASSVLLRKDKLEEVGGYDESLYIEDWDMWLRIAKKHQIHFMEGFFSQYRIHPESMMQKKASLIKVYKSLIVSLLKHKDISSEFDKIIACHLYTYSIGLYRFGVIDRHLLKVNFLFNKNLKSLFYYVAGLLDFRINQKT
jgi:glycosyltransferase involved in cell wall biosynthesis